MFGIDVSHHNGTINWEKVSKNNQKVEFVYIKCSTGVGGFDPKTKENAINAKKYGIKVGYYHFASMNDEDEVHDAQVEAEWFIKLLKFLPEADLPLALDIEEKPSVELDSNEFVNWITVFFKTLDSNGYKNYVLYSYKPYLDEHLPKNHKLGTIRLWLAQYRPKTTLPNGWNSYWLLQYTDSGKVNGINGSVDLNKG